MLMISIMLLVVIILLFVLKKPKDDSDEYNKRTTDLLPVEYYDEKAECFIYKDGSCMDIMQINSQDLTNASSSEKTYMKLKLSRWYRLYAADIKLIMMNLPTSTRTQQQYIQYKMEHTINPVYKRKLEQKLNECRWIEKNRTSREFFFMYWGKDIDTLYANRERHIESLGIDKDGMASTISAEKKEEILFKYNNQCSTVKRKGVKRDEKE